MTDFLWTTEAVDLLKACAAEGISAREISDRIARKFQHSFTKNAIIGKIDRLKIEWGRGPRERPLGPMRKRPPRRARPARPWPFLPPGAHRCGLLELTPTSCRWPVSGDGPPYLFCGDPSADLGEGRPYCPHHTLVGRP